MIYSILMSLIIVPMFISMFFLIGKIVQTKYGAFDANPYMSIPLGFILFSTLTLITYTPLIILHLPGILFIVFETLKDLAIFILIWMQRKYIKVKIDLVKVTLIFVVTLIITFGPAIFTLVKQHNDYPFHLTRNFKVYLRKYGGATLFEPWKDGNVYNSWYMFNSVIIDLFKINGDFEVWWMQSSLIGVISITTILSLLKITFKKIRVVASLIAALMLVIIFLQSVDIFGQHWDTIGFVTSSIILLVVSWDLMKKPRVRYILLTGATGFSMLSFDWSALWLYSTYMLVFTGIYIYKEKPKPTLLILFTLTFIGFMFATSLHRFTTIGSTIGMVVAVIVGMLFMWLRNKNIEVPMDKFFLRFRKWWLPILFAVFTIVSLSIWLSKPDSNLWFNFEINPRYLNTIESWQTFATVMYALYWAAIMTGITVLIFSARWKRRWDIATFLILIGLISTLFFFSPFTATFMKSYLIPNALFSSLQWTTIAPLLIGLMLKFGRAVVKKIKSEYSEIDRMINA